MFDLIVSFLKLLWAMRNKRSWLRLWRTVKRGVFLRKHRQAECHHLHRTACHGLRDLCAAARQSERTAATAFMAAFEAKATLASAEAHIDDSSNLAKQRRERKVEKARKDYQERIANARALMTAERNKLRQFVDSFLQELCNTAALMLSELSGCQCAVSMRTIHKGKIVCNTPLWQNYVNELDGDFSQLHRKLGGDPTVKDDLHVAWVRVRCKKSRFDRAGFVPWVLVEHCTPLEKVIDPKRKKKRSFYYEGDVNSDEEYEDPSDDGQMVRSRSVAVFPARSKAGSNHAIAGFIWIDSNARFSFDGLFKHHEDGEQWSPTLHFMMGLADATATAIELEALISDRSECLLKLLIR